MREVVSSAQLAVGLAASEDLIDRWEMHSWDWFDDLRRMSARVAKALSRGETEIYLIGSIGIDNLDFAGDWL